MSIPQNILEKIDDYLDGNLNNSELQFFKNELRDNIELQELIDINKQLRQNYNNDELSPLKNDQSQSVVELTSYYKSQQGQSDRKILNDVKDTYNDLDKPALKRKNRYSFIGIAAMILILLGYFFSDALFSNTDYYKEYKNWNELPSLTSKNDGNNLLSQGENAFLNKEYNEAQNYFDTYLKTTKAVNPNVLIYLGISQLEVDSYEAAVKTFDRLIASKTIDASKGYWYKALVYLKSEDKVEALEQLKIIIKDSNNYKYYDAKELIKKIDH